MEFLETLGCIWSSKEVIRVIFGRALPGATSSEATSSERHSQIAREERPGSDVFGATQPGRSRRNDPGATSRSDVPRIVSRHKVDSLIDHLPSLVRYLITQGLIPMPMSSIFP
ncbi:hypothetical protein Bca4012_086820 [Brassica carinata]